MNCRMSKKMEPKVVTKEYLLEKIQKAFGIEHRVMNKFPVFRLTEIADEAFYQSTSQLPEFHTHASSKSIFFQIDHTGIKDNKNFYKWSDILLTGLKTETSGESILYSLLIGLNNGSIIKINAGGGGDVINLSALIQLYKRKHRELIKNPPPPVKPFPYSTRLATAADIPAIVEVFQNTIQKVNAKDYTREQLNIWSVVGNSFSIWKKRLTEQYFLVCENEKEITGFASLIIQNGCIDVLYVHHAHLKNGIAKKLLSELELQAKKAGQAEVWADVSITARPFFETNHFVVKKNYLKFLLGIEFRNTIMTKSLK